MSEEGGVWRTIGGRRVFIKDGEDLATAMKNSGKPYEEIVEIARQYIKEQGGFEKFAEWGLY